MPVFVPEPKNYNHKSRRNKSGKGVLFYIILFLILISIMLLFYRDADSSATKKLLELFF